jgi:hypothetical protein
MFMADAIFELLVEKRILTGDEVKDRARKLKEQAPPEFVGCSKSHDPTACRISKKPTLFFSDRSRNDSGHLFAEHP